MSTFLGANASRPLLLRLAARGGGGVVAKSYEAAAAARWISCSGAASTLPITCPVRAAPKPRAGVFSPFFTRAPPGCQRRTLFSGGSSSRVVQRYEDLPRTYRDQAGLAFAKKELTQQEVAEVFGGGLEAVSANHLLKILHGRRVAGTLDDPAFAIHTARYSDAQMSRALEYLRRTVKVDEVLNAGLRAEDELAELERQGQKNQQAAAEDAKDDNDNDKEAKAEVRDIRTHGNVFYKPDPVYGQSSLDAIRARNRAKNKQREREEEERKAAERLREESRPQPKQLVQVEEGQRQITNPKVAEYYRQAKSDVEEAPEMSLRERLLPSFVTVLLVISFCACLATVYEEPGVGYRLLPEITTAQATVGTMIALNAAVWLGWRFPPLWKSFNRYMIFVVGLPKPVTLFTAPFSHQQASHMLVNMVPFWVVGTALHEDVGRANFVTLYLACGAVGFLGTLAAYGAAGMLGVYTLGASGANMGLCAAYFWLHRDDGFRFVGLPEDGVHGIVFLALLAGTQLARIGSIWSRTNRIDVVSHVAGMLAGVGGIEMLKRFSDYFVEGYPERAPGDSNSNNKRLVKELWWGDLVERRGGGSGEPSREKDEKEKEKEEQKKP
ncbi:hypothetical protein N3K66_001443 [Trichothecium roseum]|uniref:Uncharacterized protein n=1 Tax=Trichothecium roseum TaxID=47278 RepID=A0ACC0VES4_9HYPO|nr:hypothetical protein N3K66_001443 [Trichothecium roseum]